MIYDIKINGIYKIICIFIKNYKLKLYYRGRVELDDLNTLQISVPIIIISKLLIVHLCFMALKIIIFIYAIYSVIIFVIIIINNTKKQNISHTYINLSTIANTLTIFSSFFDYRYFVIRIIAITSNKIKITCTYTLDKILNLCNYQYKYFRKDSSGTFFKSLYVNIIVFLKKNTSVPKYICINNKNINIIYNKNKIKNNVLCITTLKLFNSYNLLLQTLSVYLYYGINKIILYVSDDITFLNKIMNIEGIIIHIIHIQNDNHLSKTFYYGQIVKYNDCLYRNMFNSNYVLFTDFDELIILKKNIKFYKLIKALPKADIYYFKSAICPTTNYSEYKKFHKIKDINLTNTLKCCMLKKYSYRKYIITSPFKFIKINIHYIDYSAYNYKEIYVNSEYGYIHHSRIPTYSLLSNCSDWFYDISLKNTLFNCLKKNK